MKSKRLSMGASAIALSSALKVAVQIAVLPIIGRLLGPHVYGQLALVAPFVFFSMMLAESGLGACIIRAHIVTRALEGTVFCFSACLSLLFMALFALLAHPLGRYLQEPMFAPLLMGLSVILLLASFNIVPAALLLRAQRYGWIAASDVASSIGSLAGVGLGIALDWGAWSLVAQQIAMWLCKLAVVSIGAKTPPRLNFSWTVLKEIMQFGSLLTGGAIVGFFARNIDNVLIGRFLGTEVLGFYALAFQIVGMPQMIVAGSIYFSLFAGTSEAVRSGGSPKPQFLAVLRGIMLLCMPALAGMAATANLSIPLIMGAQWGPSARLLILLAPLGLCQTLGAAIGGVLNGIGHAGTLLKVQTLSSFATIVAILATVRMGSDAVAIGVSLTALSLPLMAMHTIARECAIDRHEIIHAIGGPVTGSLLMAAGVVLLQMLLPTHWPLATALVVCVGSGLLLYAAIMLVLFRDRLSEDMLEVKLILRRGGK